MSSKKELTPDQRFIRVTKDPRFWEMPEKDKKIKIDKRFKAMFHDKKFSLKYTVDKRGRPINHNTAEDLKRYYDLSDSSDEASEKETKPETTKGKQKAKLKQKASRSTDKAPEKVHKEKKKDQRTSEANSNVENKKGKVKENHLAKGENEGHLKSLKTAHKSTSHIQPASTSGTSVEQEESEESAASDEDMEDIGSGEDDSKLSGTDLDEAASSEDDEDEGDGSEESDEEDVGSEDGEDSDSGPDLARGKGNIETSSEEEDEDGDNDDDEADTANKDTEIEHAWRELDKDAPRGDEVTRRLAVCNMDWDRLKAKDLLALFNSFKPKGGIVFSVKIYPSEFGKERLKEEELRGPVELKEISEDVAEEKGVYKEKLREYQFKRLKYFYAVVECDSPQTANTIYEECDGLEFETSCSFVDLRFVPDDVQFDEEPKDSAVDVDLAAYKPKLFTSSANVTSKVALTWDETDQERVTTLNRPFKKTELLDMDFQAYLASSSEEEEEEILPDNMENEEGKSKKGPKDDEEQIARYRDLLKSIQEKEKKQEEKDVEMEVKWVPGLKESAEQMVKNKLDGKDKLTPWEKYLQKQKDKRKMKRKKQNSVEGKDEEDDEMPSDVDLDDPFFSEELDNPGMKKKSVAKKEELSSEEEDKERKQAEMALLMMDDIEDDRKHFNYDKIVEQQNLSRSKKKKLKKKEELVEDEFQINVEDSRFQAMYTSHLYNVDPSDPSFKKTKAMERVLQEKARRREQEQKAYTDTVKKHQAALESAQKMGTSSVKTRDPSLSLLLKSVKSKTQQFQASKKQKLK